MSSMKKQKANKSEYLGDKNTTPKEHKCSFLSAVLVNMQLFSNM